MILFALIALIIRFVTPIHLATIVHTGNLFGTGHGVNFVFLFVVAVPLDLVASLEVFIAFVVLGVILR